MKKFFFSVVALSLLSLTTGCTSKRGDPQREAEFFTTAYLLPASAAIRPGGFVVLRAYIRQPGQPDRIATVPNLRWAFESVSPVPFNPGNLDSFNPDDNSLVAYRATSTLPPGVTRAVVTIRAEIPFAGGELRPTSEITLDVNAPPSVAEEGREHTR